MRYRSVDAPHVFVDADALMQDLRYAARTGQLGIVGQIAAVGELTTTPGIVADVDRHLDKLSIDAEHGERLRALWRDRYMPALRVASAEDDPGPMLARLLSRDPDDVPLAALSLQAERPVLLTNDTDLTDEGFATFGWLSQARLVQQAVAYDAGISAAALGVELALAAAREVVGAATAGSRSAQVSICVVAAALLWLAASAQRRETLRATGGDLMGLAVAASVARAEATAILASQRNRQIELRTALVG